MPAQRSRPGLRAALLFGLPSLALLALVVSPLALGRETLILRDVLQVHLAMKASQARAYEAGYLPVIDPYRGGGQPLTGNPNALPFYPDDLLYLGAPPLWALNAHFWLHLLLAPLAGYWMGRAWGLGRPGSWAAGVCYATSGFFLSHLNFYNLVAGAALAPALVAAVLMAGAGRRWAAPAAGLLWGLILVSGDPLSAVLAGALAGSAYLARPGAPSGAAGPHPTIASLLPLAGALLLGTLAALPQIVELLRVLPATHRGYWGFAEWRLVLGSFRPVHALEWLVPTAFGRFDLGGEGGFWGLPLYDGDSPFFLSLYPGLLALALVAASGRPRSRPAWWGWGVAAAGAFLALGGHNPVARWLFELPGARAFRFPVKLWLLVAVGAALLCGIGFERVFGRGSDRPRPTRLGRLGWPLAVLGVLLAAVLLFVVLAPGRFEAWNLAHAREGWTAALAAAERARWIAVLAASLALLAALAGCLVLARRRPAVGACLLLALHAAGQLYLLRSLRVTDDAAFYREPPPLLAAVPEGATVVDAEYAHLFGPSHAGVGPDNRPVWPIRQDYLGLAPFSGVLHGLRYELNRSPEGLYSFLGRVAADAVRASRSDADRVRALARWGVDAVVTAEPLRDVPPELAAPVARWEGITSPIHVYRLPRPAPEVLFAETELPVPHLNAAWDLFRSPGFDPRRHVVLPGPEDAPAPALPAAAAGSMPQGRLRVLAGGPESLEVETASPVPGVLVVQRSLLPIWRGTVDGEAAELLPANLYRIGVRVPAGRHRVRLWVDRRPLVLSGAAALLGLLGLAGWAALGLRGSRPPADTIPAP